MSDVEYFDIIPYLLQDSIVNAFIGIRGSGKTVSSTFYIRDNFLDKEEQFLYIRRKRTEITKAAPNLFKKDFYNFNPKVGQGKYIYKDKICGYYINLTEAQNLKSGYDLDHVTTVLFDEFITKNIKDYLISEYDIFSDVLDTCIRLRDNVKIIFLGNSYNFYNPYTIKWGCRMKKGKTIWKSEDKFILLKLINDEKYIQQRKQSVVGRFSAGTEYEQMATFNRFINESDNDIGKRNNNHRVIYNIITHNNVFNLWYDYNTGTFVVDLSGYDVKNKICTDLTKMTTNTRYIKTDYPFIQFMRAAINNGTLFYTSNKIKYLFLPVLQLI